MKYRNWRYFRVTAKCFTEIYYWIDIKRVQKNPKKIGWQRFKWNQSIERWKIFIWLSTIHLLMDNWWIYFSKSVQWRIYELSERRNNYDNTMLFCYLFCIKYVNCSIIVGVSYSSWRKIFIEYIKVVLLLIFLFFWLIQSILIRLRILSLVRWVIFCIWTSICMLHCNILLNWYCLQFIFCVNALKECLQYILKK